MQTVRKQFRRGTRFSLVNVLSNQSQKVLISIHYWSEYRKGQHLVCSVEANENHLVSDIIKYAIHSFECMKREKGVKIDLNPEHYVMRLASKQGLPKTDLPILHSDQQIIGMKFQRFALCHKEADAACRDTLEYEEGENRLDTLEKGQSETIMAKVFYYITCQCFVSNSET